MTDEIRLTLHTTPGQSAAAMMRAIRNSPGQGRRHMLAMALIGAGASVEHRSLPTGHGLSQADLGLVREWLARPGRRAR